MDDPNATTAELQAECPLTPDQQGTVKVVFFRALGLVCVGLGILGAFLPLLPTTVFFIVAVWCFAKSAPAWRQRILDHPRYGPPVRRFTEHGIIPRRVKVIALTAIAANFTLSVLFVAMAPLTVAILATVLLAVSAYIATRPETAAVKVES
jgi:uncharacterized membrane protein YbaN (DUF454 family)